MNAWYACYLWLMYANVGKYTSPWDPRAYGLCNWCRISSISLKPFLPSDSLFCRFFVLKPVMQIASWKWCWKQTQRQYEWHHQKNVCWGGSCTFSPTWIWPVPWSESLKDSPILCTESRFLVHARLHPDPYCLLYICFWSGNYQKTKGKA